MCYNNGKTYSIGAVNDYCTCNSNGRITCKAEVSVTEEVTGVENYLIMSVVLLTFKRDIHRSSFAPRVRV